MRRRPLIASALALATTPLWAATPPGPVPPLRFGVDRSLDESGLAARLAHAFGGDTGIAIKLIPGPSSSLLDALRDGEIDAALANAPDLEADLERQGLVHDRRAVALGDFLLVGPVPRTKGKPAPKATAATGVLEAMARLREAALATPGSVTFLSAGDGSGLHLAEQSLWRAAGISPEAPWYAAANPKAGFVGQVRARGAWALVERGTWVEAGGVPLSVIAEGDPRLGEQVHVMRSFHSAHPAGKICMEWIGGRRGRSVAAAHRGYRAAA